MSVISGPNIVLDGLVLYLDAANPKSYPGTGTSWNDLSGNNKHATIYNSPTFSNGRFTFAPGEYITYSNPIPDQPILEAEWTVSAFVNIDDTDTQQLIADQDLHRGCHLKAWANNSMILYLNSGDNDYYSYSTADADEWLFNQGWKFVEFKFRNSDGTRKICVNLTDHASGGPNATSTPRANASTWASFVGVNGNASFLTMYDRMLTDDESSRNFNAYRSRFGL